MKKNSIFSIVAVMFAIAVSQTAHSADATTSQVVNMTVNGSNLIKVFNKDAAGPETGTTAVSLTLSGATEAGAAISPVAADSSTRLRMSCLTVNTEKRKLTAKITSGGSFTGHNTKLELALRTPLNIDHFVNYSTNASTGVGTFVTLGDNNGNTASAGTLVSGIMTSWTGTAVNDGYEIYYRYSSTVGQTAIQTEPVTVTFTIEAN